MVWRYVALYLAVGLLIAAALFAVSLSLESGAWVMIPRMPRVG